MTLLILAVAVTPHAYQFVAERGLCSDTDDGIQVDATIRWLQSGTYVTPIANAALSDPLDYRPENRWPRGYSILVALLLKIGIPLMWSLVVLNLLFLVGAAVGWFRLCREIFGDELLAALLVILITWRISMSPADLFCCAVAPFLLISLVRILNSDVDENQKYRLGAVSLMIVAMVFMKYSALYFIPGVFVILLVDSLRNGRLKRDLVRHTMVVLPATLLFLGTYSWNRQTPDVIDQISEIEAIDHDVSNIKASRLLSLPFTTFFLEPIKLNSVVRAVLPGLSSRTSIGWRSWLQILNLILLAATIGLVAYYWKHLEKGKRFQSLTFIVLVLGLSCAVLLLAVDVSKSTVGHVRTYRYYAPVAPVLLAFYLQSALHLYRRGGSAAKALGICVAILFLPFLTWVGQQVWRAATSPALGVRAGMEFVNETSSRVRGDEPGVFFGHIRTYCQSTLPVVNLNSDRSFWDESAASDSVWLFLLLNRNVDRSSYVEPIDALVREFDLGGEERDGWEIYYRRFGPGKLRSDVKAP
jgi:hypothetical protein